jgi:hypothetical protein
LRLDTIAKEYTNIADLMVSAIKRSKVAKEENMFLEDQFFIQG